jgi:molybdopterin molybdotransferase
MEIEIQLTHEPIAEIISVAPSIRARGAWLEFRGVVRDEEGGRKISALEYEAYSPMAEIELRRILESLAKKFPCFATKIIHRTGIIPVGETAIYVGIASAHRGEAIAALAEFMDKLKQDVPIWKRRGIAVAVSNRRNPSEVKPSTPRAPLQLNEAISEIKSHCEILPAVRVPLTESFGRVLRETVCAPSDFPDCDRSTRDGYAILQSDSSEIFQVVDTLHAADWKPQQLKTGEAVRIATGAALPSENLRVVMQENVERTGDNIRIKKLETSLNLRKRGEDVRAGQPLLQMGARLDSGKMALLASAGIANPLVGPRLRVVHFTTGNEIISPDQTPKPGQIRDSNSFLIRALLQRFSCEVKHQHLPENFNEAWHKLDGVAVESANLVLVSGGASVGDTDFTRALIEKLGHEIIFRQIDLRPGRPLIFGRNESRIAFGLPGNPLSHFVCFHLFVMSALAKMLGTEPQKFLRGKLASELEDATCPRETLWPARLDLAGLYPLKWSSSGDVTCFAEANALIRVPPNVTGFAAGAEVEFWPTEF